MAGQRVIHNSGTQIPSVPIIFDLLWNQEVGAWAYPKHQGSYSIGMSTGTVFVLRSLFYRLLSDPNVLPGVGRGVPATIAPTAWPDALTDATNLPGGGMTAIAPADSERVKYADFLLDQAIEFILHHEVAHIVNGHVDYDSRHRGLLLLPERGFMPVGPEATLDHQAI